MHNQKGEIFTVLESRVQKLEEKVLGKGRNYTNLQDVEIVTSLSEFSSKLGIALSTRDRMMMVMKRLDELERYMDPSYGEFDINDNTKLDLILMQEENLQNQYKLLCQLTTLKTNLDSKPFADSATTMNSELSRLYSEFGETRNFANEQGNDIAKVVENYNSVIKTLTETYSKMDKIVSQAENAAQPKKVYD